MREPDKSRKSAWWRVRSACTALKRDRDGSALFYTTLALPVLVGFAVLAIDGSRLMNLNSTLQHAADGLALAAAGELDRSPDACERAVRALTNLVENDQMFGELGAATITIGDVKWTFLSELPANDWEPIPASMVVDPCDDADDAALVRYIEVWVKPQNFNTLFPASFLGGSNTARTNAVAVAGFDAVVCEFTPLFICNPFENDPNFDNIYEAAEDPEVLGRQMQIRKIGPSGSVGPGNYGFLQPSTGPGASELKKMFGMAKPPACFLQSGVEVQTGAIAAVGPWLNTRFDLYEKGANTVKTNSQYRPALNVRKGYTYSGNACNAAPDEEAPKAMGLPRDDCFSSATPGCPYLGGQMGDGTWNFDAYWDANFSGAGVAKPNCGATPCSNANPPSRHSMYLYELANGLVPRASVGGEVGTPMCQPTTDTSVDRRLIYAAVINCIEHEEKLVGGAGGKIPVEAFVELFVTEPVKNAANESLENTNIHDIFWLELVQIIEPGPDTKVARDRVQLFR